jgi:hypothetical protein
VEGNAGKHGSVTLKEGLLTVIHLVILNVRAIDCFLLDGYLACPTSVLSTRGRDKGTCGQYFK